MKKPMLVMLIIVGAIFCSIFAFKILQNFLMYRFMTSHGPPPITVSAMKVNYSWWPLESSYAASMRSIRGVSVTTELAGMVQTISFRPGDIVKQGTTLVQLNADPEIAQLRALQAQADLAKINYERDKAQYAIRAVSKAVVDQDAANVKNTQALVDQQAATLAKKTIRAPFSGKLGISAVNPGQFLNTGDMVVRLETLDPIWVDFFAPQQDISKLKLGQVVSLTTDAFPEQTFAGKITTIEPAVDVNTRNIQIEATVANPNNLLIPGMFGTVTVNFGAPQSYLTLPQTAINYNSFGDIVYIIEQSSKKDEHGKPVLIARQAFVITGQKRGDQVAVLKGLKEGETVVTSGQLKLKNGSVVTIDNSVVPDNNPNPIVSNER